MAFSLFMQWDPNAFRLSIHNLFLQIASLALQIPNKTIFFYIRTVTSVKKTNINIHKCLKKQRKKTKKQKNRERWYVCIQLEKKIIPETPSLKNNFLTETFIN